MRDDVQERYRAMIKVVSSLFFLKTILGAVLLIIGCFTAFRILAMIFRMIYSPRDMPLVHWLAQIGKDGAALDVLGETLTFSPVTMAYGNIVLSYGLVLILLGIGAGLAKAFLSAGSRLIQSGLESLVDTLGEDLSRWWQARGNTDQKVEKTYTEPR